MRRVHENIKEFKNGNLSIRFTKLDALNIEIGHVSAMEVLSWLLEKLDCVIIGDEFNLNNYDMGVMIYNRYSDLVYIMSLNEADKKFTEGKWLRLYGRKPTEDDRVLIDGEE